MSTSQPICESPATLLLAAGYSHRFGSDKTLYPLAEGTPMALVTARLIKSVLPRLLVVVRPDQQRLQALLDADEIAYSLNYSAVQGMSASLRAGVLATPQANGWLIALADMPRVKPKTYVAIYQMLVNGNDNLLCAPYHQGQRGHPIGFGKSWKNALLSCHGDQGGRSILQQHAASIDRVSCDDLGTLYDMDKILP